MSSFGTNTGYVDDLYEQFLRDPRSVSPAWQEFFADYRGSGAIAPAPEAPPTPRVEPTVGPPGDAATATATETTTRVTVTAESPPLEDEPPSSEETPRPSRTSRGPMTRTTSSAFIVSSAPGT